MSSPTVNLTLADYDAMRDRIVALEMDLKTAQMDAAQAASRGNNNGAEIRALIDAMMDVVRFAVQNLPPEHVVGWPWGSLGYLARLYAKLPWATNEHQELSAELQTFADECEAMATVRSSRKGLPPGPPADKDELGPQTEEALAVHEAMAARMKSA